MDVGCGRSWFGFVRVLGRLVRDGFLFREVFRLAVSWGVLR